MANGYYLFSASVTNSSNQSAIAMAAYRSGDKLYSFKDGETKSYKKREVEPESFILKPDNAPDWTLERERLWNEVEAFENRDNAQISRNVLIALPNDMTHEQQRKVTEGYVQNNFVDDGMVADVSIHRDDTNNPHAHIMLTVRPFDEHGNWERRKSKRVPVLDDYGKQVYNDKGWKVTRSIKLKDWDRRDKLHEWRENWSVILNEKSREYGLDKTYSEKSFEDQGRLENAEIRLTRQEYQFEKRKKEKAIKEGIAYQPTTYYAKRNEEIKEYNKKLSHVMHLQDYKTNRNFKAVFDNIRKNQPYDQERIEATKKMVDRAKGYVNYSIAKDLYYDFHSETSKWKLKLKRDATALNSKKEFYNHLIEEYAKNKESVLKYGYSIDGFKKEVAKNLEQEVKNQHIELKQEIDKFNELKHAAHVSFSFQKDILQHEFYAIYGNSEHSFTDDEKNFAVQLVKDYQICLPEDKIKEEYLKSFEKDDEYKYVPAWKQAKDTIVSLNIYNRTLNKLKNVNFDNLTAEDRKDTVIQYRTVTNLKAVYMDILSNLEPLIDEELKIAFKDLPHDDILDKTSVEVKSALIEKYHSLSVEQQSTVTFNELVKATVKEKVSQYEQGTQKVNELGRNHQHKDAYHDVAKQYKRIVDGLIHTFEEIARGNQTDRLSKNKDSTKTYRRKGTDGREL